MRFAHALLDSPDGCAIGLHRMHSSKEIPYGQIFLGLAAWSSRSRAGDHLSAIQLATLQRGRVPAVIHRLCFFCVARRLRDDAAAIRRAVGAPRGCAGVFCNETSLFYFSTL